MKNLLKLFVLLFITNLSIAQTSKLVDINISWGKVSSFNKIPTFNEAEYTVQYQNWPVFSTNISLNQLSNIEVLMTNPLYEEVKLTTTINKDQLKSTIDISTRVEKSRYGTNAIVHFTPFINSRGKILKLISCQLQLKVKPIKNITFRRDYKEHSILSNGDIYKISLTKTGIYKMDRALLLSLGIDVDNIKPDEIHLYGHTGGALPQSLKTKRIDDLQELSINIIGGTDGSFDKNDYILFYAMGSEGVQYEKTNDLYRYQINKNIYTDSSYYFLVINSEAPKHALEQVSLENAIHESTSFNSYTHLEIDLYNLLGQSRRNEGSGQLWVGREFTNSRQKDYSNDFNVKALDKTKDAHLNASFVARSSRGSNVQINIDGNTFKKDYRHSIIADVESTYADIVRFDHVFSPNKLNIDIDFTETTQLSKGWLDYITINYFQNYDATVIAQKTIIDPQSLDHPTSFFELKNTSSRTQTWDITNPMSPLIIIPNTQNDKYIVGYNSSSLKQFVCFDPLNDVFVPTPIGKVDNQDLHGITKADEIIIYHRDFEEAAKKLLDHRINHSKMNVKMVRVDRIMNEFAAGKMDPTAIRDFVKMIHDRDTEGFKYLVLLGDGSYDYLHKVKNTENQNFIPAYETKESLYPIEAYPSDDYYALLDDHEGKDLNGGLDIAVGRLLSRTLEEANIIIDRIINYETSPEGLKDWKNQILFSADDEDGNLHIRDVDDLCKFNKSLFPEYNQQKIYLDAFEQVSTPGGQRYPSVTEAIDQSIFKGVFAYTYLGHGGPTGMAQERILQINDVINWSNDEKVPIFLTATCSFTPYDDPEITSIGEHVVLHPKGGSVALLSTVRAVFASSNARLTKKVLDGLFRKDNNKRPKIGDVVINAKNNGNAATKNNRKFSLFGDPAMDVMLPLYDVVTDEINGIAISQFNDTLHALDKVTIKGHIKDYNGSTLDDFNGILYPTIFDKKIVLKTKANDKSESYVFPFEVQKNILYKGASTIKDGKFEFTFNIPKDINYKIGVGKISYYASDLVSRDANGNYDSLYIGGAGLDSLLDDEGPKIEVFMNTFDFAKGGITGPDPVLLVRLSDDIGINVSGTSIGHDLTGILDADKNNKFILNEHYEAAIDDYTKGTIRFPLKDLESGLHHIKIIAWDIANNSAEGFTEFLVEDDAKIALKRVLNYPNPFVNSTNFQFEHNLANSTMDILIRIFTVSGKLIKTIEVNRTPIGNIVNDIHWDGNDDFGNNLGKGVYIYKINVSSDVIGGSETKKTESEFEKLVILK